MEEKGDLNLSHQQVNYSLTWQELNPFSKVVKRDFDWEMALKEHHRLKPCDISTKDYFETLSWQSNHYTTNVIQCILNHVLTGRASPSLFLLMKKTKYR